ncbi:MAG: hypothetical protein JWO09_1295 [Bacteroidetes bacterium]|nr:hypothetical protein [Bacteroidota bacterium]
MKRKLLLVLVLGWMSSAVMAQDGATKLLSSPALQEITVLKDLAGQIAKAETAVASTSRSNAAAAQEKVTALYATYEKELQNQKSIHAKDAATVAAIEKELSLVTKK